MHHHAFAIEAEKEVGIEVTLGWVERELGMSGKGNPDIVILKYGLFSVEDARRVGEIAAQGPIAGDTKAVIIAANRAYREAQNALLKLFEEPPEGTYLFLILPTLGGLLPTLRSRVQVIAGALRYSSESKIAVEAMQFLKASREQRIALIKKLTSGKDEEERREYRDAAVALLSGIEAAAYTASVERHAQLLGEIQTLRAYLHQPSAPLKMILEHFAIVTPRDLV